MNTAIDTQLVTLRESLQARAEKLAEALTHRLERNASADEFLDWLLRYDAFNRGFPGAAAGLAGRIAGMIDRFGDIEAEMIASRVMAAITDEFLDRGTGAMALHSKLRRELVIFCLAHLSRQSRAAALGVVRTYDPLRREVLVAAQEGYGLTNDDEFVGVFRGLGFFAASETSGSTEFVTLNRYMDAEWPGLKSVMQATNDEQGRALYAWVAEHQDLEADHAKFAFSSIEKAIQYLGSDEERMVAIEEIKRGIANFFAMAESTLLSGPTCSQQRQWLRQHCPRCQHEIINGACACAGYAGH